MQTQSPFSPIWPQSISRVVALIVIACIGSAAPHAQPNAPGLQEASGPPSTSIPTALKDVGFEQRLNQLLPLDLAFRDEDGRSVRLAQYFGRRPVVLALVYYECPMLCTQVLNGLTSALSILDESVGREFDVVTVSFDPRETPVLASGKKKPTSIAIAVRAQLRDGTFSREMNRRFQR